MTIRDSDLAKNPRKVTLTSVRDGHTKEFTDDGASITPDGVFPHGNRQHLLMALGKMHVQGKTKDGPRINSWVLTNEIEPGVTSNPKVDPALAGRKLSDAALNGKTYADVIEANKAEIKKVSAEETRLAFAAAQRTFNLSPESLQMLAELVAAKSADAAVANKADAAAKADADKGSKK